MHFTEKRDQQTQVFSFFASPVSREGLLFQHDLLFWLLSFYASHSALSRITCSCPSTPTHPRPHFSFLTGTLIQKATALEATEECWPGLPSGVFQTPHCSLRPKYLPLEWVRVSPFFFFFANEDYANQYSVGTDQTRKSH